MTYPALHIFKFGQDLQSKTIRLASRPVPPVHVVPKGQNKTHDVPQMFALQQVLTETGTNLG